MRNANQNRAETEGEPTSRASNVRSEAPVVDLDDSRGCCSEIVGNKAAKLAELRREGFDVPPGIVFSAAWCDDLMADESAGAVEAINSVLSTKLDQRGEGPYAVRSSGVAEDGSKTSMAGQFRSELDVEPGEIPDAVIRCLEATPFVSSPTEQGAGMAVLIQPMVDADFAGVAFSRDPVTGDDVCVISAVEGLADKLVGGETQGEDWRINDGEIREPTVDDPILTPRKVREIGERVDQIADVFGEPQDVEWVWSDKGLQIVQARPITALPVPPPEETVPDGTWIKDVTHYPNGMKPLAASVYAPALEDAMAHAFGEWGLIIERVEQLIHRHEAYGKIVPVGGGDGPPPPAFMLGIVGRILPAMRRRAKKAKRALDDNLGQELLDRWRTEDRPSLERRIRELRNVDRAALSDEDAIKHLDDCIDVLREGQRVHFMLFPPYVIALHELVRFTENRFGWDVHRTLELLAGLSNETSGPARDLNELGRLAEQEPDVLETLTNADVSDDALIETLEIASPEFAERWNQFLERWGHRVMGYGPGEPTLVERPGVVRRRVVEFARDAEHDQSGLGEKRREAEREVRSRLGDDETDEFHRLLERARSYWPVREENIAITDSMTCAVVRYAALELGRRLAERQLLPEPEDAVMLGRDELVDSLRSDRNVRNVARRRRAECAWVAAHPGPPVLNGPDHPPPNLRFMPEAIRRTSGAMLWMVGLEYDVSESPEADDILVGQAGSPGRARGPVRIIDGPHDFGRVRAGDIMVCPTTTPAWTVVFSTIDGLVTEGGGALAHAAIAAREHHLPAVIGLDDARQQLEDGTIVEIDGTDGTIEVVS